MELGPGTHAMALLAGMLSVLSPCVLPVAPIVLGGAAAAHRHGPLALAAGLATTFALVGTALASAGNLLGLERHALRSIAAVTLVLFGLVLVSHALHQRFSVGASGLSNLGHALLHRVNAKGAGGQLLVGALLGLVWSPCVGPTLGAAVSLASQGDNVFQVALVMVLYGVGAALPLLALGRLSRALLHRWRPSLAAVGASGGRWMGALMVVVGLTILTGADKGVETWATVHAPDWLIQLTTAY